MSLTPLPLAVSMTPPTAPSGEAVACGPGAGDPAAAGFAALVAGLLGEGHGPAVPADPTDETAEAPEGAESPATSEAVPTGAPSILTAVVPALPAQAPVAWRPPGIDPPADPDLAIAPATLPVEGAATPATPPATPATPAAPAAVDAPSRQQPAVRSEEAPAPATSTTTTATPVVSATPVDGQAAVPTAAAAGPDRARTAALVDQLAPTMARLVSRGEGVHRLTMKLQPEALGEVRVTFTVRQGEVRVHLAGSEDTQRLLADGAPELRRVLEMTGVTDARVFVRDHPTSAALPQNPTGLLPGQDPTSQQGQGQRPSGDAFDPGTGAGGNHDQQARTRAGTTARDGLTDAAPEPRPEPARRDPVRGLDLTM